MDTRCRHRGARVCSTSTTGCKQLALASVHDCKLFLHELLSYSTVETLYTNLAQMCNWTAAGLQPNLVDSQVRKRACLSRCDLDDARFVHTTGGHTDWMAASRQHHRQRCQRSCVWCISNSWIIGSKSKWFPASYKWPFEPTNLVCLTDLGIKKVLQHLPGWYTRLTYYTYIILHHLTLVLCPCCSLVFIILQFIVLKRTPAVRSRVFWSGAQRGSRSAPSAWRWDICRRAIPKFWRFEAKTCYK